MYFYLDLGVNIFLVEFEVLGYFLVVVCFLGEFCFFGIVDYVGEGFEFIGRVWRILIGMFLLK